MIISDATSNQSTKKMILLAAISAIVLVLFYLFFPAKVINPKPAIPGSFYCDMEAVEGEYFLSSGTYFNAASTQNGDYSRSGKYSCFLKKAKGYQYGAGLKLPGFKPGESYKASVWKFREKGGDDGHLIASGNGEGKFYKGSSEIIKSIGGWDLLEVYFKIPAYKKVDEVSVYVLTEGKYPVYFDDLLIQKTKDAPVINTTTWVPQTIQLQLEDKALRKLNKKRDRALQNGILESSDGDWVKTKIVNKENNETIKASLRLKGDWLDHLKDDKWSFRIKTKTGETFNRLRYFSVHTPKARAYLKEWVLHELFKQEDVLTTYYDFLILELNDKSQGVYAIEEHFDKVLLERQKRREGPIIRFSEEGFWQGMKRHLFQIQAIDHDVQLNVRKPKVSPITPFQENKTMADTTLRDQFEQAVILMEQYKQGQVPAAQIFDLEKTARYFAICEALGAYHGITWHNQRFYFNPVTSLLEPIGYDGFAEKTIRRNFLIGMGALNAKKVDKESIENFLFLDRDFTEQYAFYIQKYTSRSFLTEFFASIEEEFEARKALIKTEFEDYTFNKDQLIVNALRLHSTVLPFNDHSLKAYTQKKNKGTKTLKIANFHGLPVELLGSGKAADSMTDTFESRVVLEAFHERIFQTQRQKDSAAIKIRYNDMWHAQDKQEIVSYHSVTVDEGVKYLFFKPLGIDSVFYSKIYDWKLDDGPTVKQSIFKNISLVSNDIYSVSESMVFFKEGQHQVSKSIVIPVGYRVVFQAGCQLDFIKKSKFISKSPVFINGTVDAPVRIRSSDKSAQGFTVLQAEGTSKLHYAEFDQFNTLTEKGWTLTGAVTFYESDVLIDHSVFKNNLCEDALNIIRSEFTLEKSLLTNTFGDGLDADFCKGEIKKVSFVNTGNDGMDFSGSLIFIYEANIENAGDKGVSVGEDSDTSIRNITIKGANIAVAAKDLSTLVIENIDIENCNQGFIAFQKKPEFGGADIIVNKYSADRIKRLHNIREGSTLQLLDRMIKGEQIEN